MTSGRAVALAEALLALLTTRERAAAVAGDLAEEARGRGSGWFMLAVPGVALALFAAAFGAERRRMLGLLVAGLAGWAGVYLAVRATGAAAGLQPMVLPLADGMERPWAVQVYLSVALVLAGLIAGAALGTRPAAHGVNAVTPLAAWWVVVALVAPLADLLAGRATWDCVLLYLVGVPLLYVLPLLTGGALGARAARRRAG